MPRRPQPDNSGQEVNSEYRAGLFFVIGASTRMISFMPQQRRPGAGIGNRAMIVITKANIDPTGGEFKSLIEYLENKPNIRTNIHHEVGAQQTLTEIYLRYGRARLGRNRKHASGGSGGANIRRVPCTWQTQRRFARDRI